MFGLDRTVKSAYLEQFLRVPDEERYAIIQFLYVSLQVTCQHLQQKKIQKVRFKEIVQCWRCCYMSLCVTLLHNKMKVVVSLRFWAKWCVEQTLWLDWWQTSYWRADCGQCDTADQAAASTGCGWLVEATWTAAETPQSGVPCQAHLSYSTYHRSESVLDTDKRIVTKRRRGSLYIVWSLLHFDLNMTRMCGKSQQTPPIFRWAW